MSSVPERSDVPTAQTWDLSALYADDEAWETAYESAQARIEELRAFDGTATDDAETLHDLLETNDAVMRQVESVHLYARLRRDEDTRDSDAQAMATRAESLQAAAAEAASFIEPAIQALGRDGIEEYVAAEPALEPYEHYFDDILRTKPHTRSPAVESLLAELGDVTDAPEEIFTMLANADLTFPAVEGPDGESHEVTRSNFATHLKRPERAFRRDVFAVVFDEWETVRNAVATALRKQVTAQRKLARTRHYDTARQAAMDEPNVPVGVYETLVDTVRDNVDTLHRFLDLRRRALGVSDLRPWDLYVPMVAGDSPDIPYERAREWVEVSVAPLGDEYQRRLAEGLDSRWVDVHETRGKKSNAYSAGGYDAQPYILLNYQDDIGSMTTLAHELGHSMHTALASASQPYVYYEYESFVAEVASMVNQTLLTHYLLETVDDEHLRRHVLDDYLSTIRGVLYTQTMFAEFEHRIHRQAADGEALTADRLDRLYRDLWETYLDPVVVEERAQRQWMMVPHFYMNFYVYQYATGLSAALAIVDGLLDDEADVASDYLDFLRKGSSEYPMALLRGVGVDLTEPDPYEAATRVFAEYLDEFERVA